MKTCKNLLVQTIISYKLVSGKFEFCFLLINICFYSTFFTLNYTYSI